MPAPYATALAAGLGALIFGGIGLACTIADHRTDGMSGGLAIAQAAAYIIFAGCVFIMLIWLATAWTA